MSKKKKKFDIEKESVKIQFQRFVGNESDEEKIRLDMLFFGMGVCEVDKEGNRKWIDANRVIVSNEKDRP